VDVVVWAWLGIFGSDAKTLTNVRVRCVSAQTVFSTFSGTALRILDMDAAFAAWHSGVWFLHATALLLATSQGRVVRWNNNAYYRVSAFSLWALCGMCTRNDKIFRLQAAACLQVNACGLALRGACGTLSFCHNGTAQNAPFSTPFRRDMHVLRFSVTLISLAVYSFVAATPAKQHRCRWFCRCSVRIASPRRRVRVGHFSRGGPLAVTRLARATFQRSFLSRAADINSTRLARARLWLTVSTRMFATCACTQMTPAAYLQRRSARVCAGILRCEAAVGRLLFIAFATHFQAALAL